MKSKSCGRSGCSKTWDRDPVYEVECPQCGADVGVKCKRPSGHGVWHDQGRGWHKSRDIAAHNAGAYGECPSGRCPQPTEYLEPDEEDQ